MKPDDELLALWVEDELDMKSHGEVDSWAAARPDWSERRKLARATKSLLGQVMGAEEEVPHAEFFNARIRREVSLEAVPTATPVREVNRWGNRWAWLMPLTAAAGLVMGIWIGRSAPQRLEMPMMAPVAELAPLLYTPEQGVDAKIVASDEATVILLAGVAAIPDSWEIPEVAAVDMEEREHTASAEE